MAKIYYLFGYTPRTGGDYVNLDHVQTLKNWGLDVKIIYMEDLTPEQDTTEIENAFHNLPITYSCRERTPLNPDDIVVFTECQPGVIKFAQENAEKMKCRLIMHNQNPFYTHVGFESAQYVNSHPMEQIFVPSDYTVRRLQETGITKPMQVIHPYIPDYFAPKPKSINPIKIAFSSRKRSDETDIVKFYIRSLYSSSTNIELIDIRGSSREQVAEIMAESAIFLSFAEREAMGLMALEAMASGCHVIGFSGYSGGYNKFINETNGDWVAEGDYLAFTNYVLRAIDQIIDCPNALTLKAKAGFDMIESHFRRANFESELKTAFENILGEKING